MKRTSFPAPRMTRQQNRTAFTMWLNGCSDTALATADASSLARSYGIGEQVVRQCIGAQRAIRALAG